MDQQKNQSITATNSRGLREEVTNGLLYASRRISANTSKTLETASFLYALVEILNEKDLINLEELGERKQLVGERLVKQYKEKGIAAVYQDGEYDKYSFKDGAEIDCANRLRMCKAACCRLPFALSKQELNEGIVRWDLGQPYLIDQGKDGYCNHLDRGQCSCNVYKHRPVPCRGFDCRVDKRIWLDFENKVINPKINRSDWPECLIHEAIQENET